MKIGSIGDVAAGQPAGQSIMDRISPARDQEFQKFLDKAAAAKEDKQLKEAADQFEALFIFQMMQRMRSTVMKGGLMEESMGEEIFRGMLDQEYSIKMAAAGKLGLAEMVYAQMKRK